MIRKETILTVLVTPKLLREWADDLDQAIRKATIGQNCPSRSFYGDDIQIKLMADQTAFEKYKTGQLDWS